MVSHIHTRARAHTSHTYHITHVSSLTQQQQKAGSVLSSVAILYHEVGNLDAAVQMSLAHLRILVDEFDRTANAMLSCKSTLAADEIDAVSKVIDVLRMVNTGNLEWRYEPAPPPFFFLLHPCPSLPTPFRNCDGEKKI